MEVCKALCHALIQLGDLLSDIVVILSDTCIELVELCTKLSADLLSDMTVILSDLCIKAVESCTKLVDGV